MDKLLAETISLLRDLGSAVITIRESKKLNKENHDFAEKVRKRADAVENDVVTLRNIFDERYPHLSKDVRRVVSTQQSMISAEHGFIKSEAEGLKQVYSAESTEERFSRFWNAHDLEKRLSNVEGSIERLHSKILQVLQVVNSVQPAELIEALRTEPTHDPFSASFDVPRNEGPDELKFSSSNTPECMLKCLLLPADTSHEGAEIKTRPAMNNITAVAVHGMGGVGKTFALRGVGHYEEVRQHFADGIYFMPFGQDADNETLRSNLIRIVRISGGDTVSQTMASRDNIQSVQDDAARWFRDKRCLFIADDIWPLANGRDKFVGVLKGMVRSSNHARLVISTRSQNVADATNSESIVRFGLQKWDSDTSKRVLCRNAGFELDQVQGIDRTAQYHFYTILERCNGLLLGLAMAGRSVRAIARSFDPKKKLNAWKKYHERTFAETGDMFDILHSEIPGLNDYPGLAHICEGGLKQLENAESRLGSPNLPWRQLYYRLAVCRKQQLLPLTVLQKLWGMACEKDAERLAESMADLELCETKRQQDRDALLTGISLHDLQHDFCEHMARQEHILENAHATLLDGYIPRGHGVQIRSWWCEELAHDKYIYKNLARHLISCGRPEELEGLLLDYRWTQRQAEVSGIGLVSDFEMLEKQYEHVLKQDKSNQFASGCSDLSSHRFALLHIRHILNCSREERKNRGFRDTSELSNRLFALSNIRRMFHNSWTYVMKNKNELPTHMYGRLFTERASNQWIAKYVDSLEKHTKIPWLRSLVRCMDPPTDDMIARWNVGNAVWSVASVCDSPRIVVGGKGGMLLMKDCESGAELQRFEGHADTVNCVAVSSDGRYVVSGSDDKTVCVWDAMTSSLVYSAKTSSFIDSLALSGDGRRLVFGGWDGSVGVRYFPNIGSVVCDRFSLDNYRSYWPKVAINGDGRFVATGARDGTVRKWNSVKGVAIGSAMSGHERRIECIVMNRDGSRIMSGAEDGVIVWDADQCSALSRLCEGSKNALSLSMSLDESLFAVGHKNGEMSIYGAHTFQPARRRLHGHTSAVTSVAFCSDNSRLVSGSDDNTIRYWNCGSRVLSSSAQNTRICHISYGSGWHIVMSADDKVVLVQTGFRDIAMYCAHSCAHVGSLSIGADMHSLCISNNGKFVGMIGLECMTVWKICNPKSPSVAFDTKSEHSWYVISATFSEDSTRLAANLSHGSIVIWNICNRQRIQQIDSREFVHMTASELCSVAFPLDQTVQESNFSNDESSFPLCHVTDGGFYVRSTNADVKILFLPANCLGSRDWVFDRIRGRLWLRNFEGYLFVAQLENCPQVAKSKSLFGCLIRLRLRSCSQ